MIVVWGFVFASGAAFSIWRRAFGGWLGLSRALLLAVSGGVVSGIAYLHYGVDWRVPVIAACWAWLWADGHEFDPPGKSLFYRYTAPMAVCAAVIGNPWLVAIGPAIFASYWLSWRAWPTWRAGGFIDGAYAYAELGAGFVAGAIFAASMAIPRLG